MNDQTTIRIVIGGLIVMGVASMIAYSVRPGEATYGAVTAVIGALASMLASTRKDAP